VLVPHCTCVAEISRYGRYFAFIRQLVLHKIADIFYK
jgi:hypothetical protein